MSARYRNEQDYARDTVIVKSKTIIKEVRCGLIQAKWEQQNGTKEVVKVASDGGREVMVVDTMGDVQVLRVTVGPET